LKQGYVRRKGANDVSPFLANLFSPSKRSLNLLGSESNQYLQNDGGHQGFASERGFVGQSMDHRRIK
jgi:hypothetical protein